jgi:hypothetical protein
MGRAVLGGRASLLESLMVEEAEAELPEYEDGYNNANDLVKVAEATGLGEFPVRDDNDNRNSILTYPLIPEARRNAEPKANDDSAERDRLVDAVPPNPAAKAQYDDAEWHDANDT